MPKVLITYVQTQIREYGASQSGNVGDVFFVVVVFGVFFMSQENVQCAVAYIQ